MCLSRVNTRGSMYNKHSRDPTRGYYCSPSRFNVNHNLVNDHVNFFVIKNQSETSNTRWVPGEQRAVTKKRKCTNSPGFEIARDLLWYFYNQGQVISSGVVEIKPYCQSNQKLVYLIILFLNLETVLFSGFCRTGSVLSASLYPLFQVK